MSTYEAVLASLDELISTKGSPEYETLAEAKRLVEDARKAGIESRKPGVVARRSFWALGEKEMRAMWEREVESALHWQEFAELPHRIPNGEEIAKNDWERYRYQRACVAAVRRHALQRWGEGVEGFVWPWSDGYAEAVADLDRRLAEAGRSWS